MSNDGTRPGPSAPAGARLPRPSRLLAAGLLAVGLSSVIPACASEDAPVSEPATATTSIPADHPVALLAEDDGSMLYAERLSGDVRRVRSDGVLEPEPVAHVDVVGSDSDQRGLVGLARLLDGSLIGAWVRPDDRRLVIGRLDQNPAALIWVGPLSSDLADGGHLAVAPDGRVIVGIGDLQADRALADDPAVPNRKLLSLDPDGPPGQEPGILSRGWNNPFAFTFDSEGVLWVADNTPGDEPERIGRGDRPADEATDLDTVGDGEAAPSALVALAPGRLGRCGYLTGRVDEVEVDAGTGTARLTGSVVAAPCRTGAAVLADGRLVTADDASLSFF